MISDTVFKITLFVLFAGIKDNFDRGLDKKTKKSNETHLKNKKYSNSKTKRKIQKQNKNSVEHANGNERT